MQRNNHQTIHFYEKFALPFYYSALHVLTQGYLNLKEMKGQKWLFDELSAQKEVVCISS